MRIKINVAEISLLFTVGIIEFLGGCGSVKSCAGA
jgi:hypothetical protein